MGNPSEHVSCSRKSDRRRELRGSLTSDVSILSEDELGRETVYHARLLDVSVHGMRFQVFWKLPLRSTITFYHPKSGLGGRGTVRYCNSSKKGYEIGVEFRHGTGWCETLPNEELTRLAAAVAHPAKPVATPQEVSEAK